MQDPNPYASPRSDEPLYPGYYESVNRLATRSERFWGAVIDTFVMMLAYWPVGSGIDHLTNGKWSGRDDLVFDVVMSLVGVTVFVLVNGVFLAKHGQTIGKAFMKTQIVSEQGTLLPFGTLLVRRYLVFWLLSSIPIAGAIITVVDSLAIFRTNHRCLHDELAGTQVIKLR